MTAARCVLSLYLLGHACAQAAACWDEGVAKWVRTASLCDLFR